MLSESTAPADTSNDLLLAQMMQLEYDREHDRMLRAEEKHFNKHSKGRSYQQLIVIVKATLNFHVHVSEVT